MININIYQCGKKFSYYYHIIILFPISSNPMLYDIISQQSWQQTNQKKLKEKKIRYCIHYSCTFNNLLFYSSGYLHQTTHEMPAQTFSVPSQRPIQWVTLCLREVWCAFDSSNLTDFLQLFSTGILFIYEVESQNIIRKFHISNIIINATLSTVHIRLVSVCPFQSKAGSSYVHWCLYIDFICKYATFEISCMFDYNFKRSINVCIHREHKSISTPELSTLFSILNTGWVKWRKEIYSTIDSH